MNKKKIGFIGCGHMASAIIQGFDDKTRVMGSEFSEEFAKSAQKRLSIPVISDNTELVNQSDVIFIATKPNCVEEVLKGIKDNVTSEKLVVSIAAGISTAKEEAILKNTRIVRIMPNTPALVKLGMFAITKGKYATDDDVNFVKNLLLSIGKCIIVDESEMDIVTAISGSGPAFIYQVINALAKSGERLGMDYEKALLLSAQTAFGSAKMLMDSPQSPDELIKSVATPGGCTQVGADYFEENNMYEMFYQLIKSTAEKAHALGK